MSTYSIVVIALIAALVVLLVAFIALLLKYYTTKLQADIEANTPPRRRRTYQNTVSQTNRDRYVDPDELDRYDP